MKNHCSYKYYQRYSHYIKKRNLSSIPLFSQIKNWLPKKGETIVDLGCGVGYLLNWLCQGNKYKGVGVDFSREAIKHASQLYPKIHFLKEDVTCLPFPAESFDIALAINIVEHLKDSEKFLKGARRVLKKGGILILSTPDKNSLYRKLFIHDPTHLHEFSFEETIAVVEKFFKIEKVTLTNSIGRFNKQLNFLLSRIFPCDILLYAKNAL